MGLDFTVAIPTFNGANRIPLVLEKLRSQVTPPNLSWEILVVDNNSSDRTAEVIRELQQTWDGAVPLRYTFEPQQGIAYARQRAIDESEGEFVGFLDDDNLPSPDWVASAHTFGIAHPKAGAYGSQIKADFQCEPPPNISQVKNLLVIRNYSDTPKQYHPETLRLPAGAGLVVRRQAWLESVPRKLVRASRGGNDYEISLHLHKNNWEIWHNPLMKIYHRIPPSRLERSYLLPIAYLYGLATCDLRMISATPLQSPFLLCKLFLGSSFRLVRHWYAYRGQFQSHLGAACELEFLRGQLLSPLVFLQRHLLK